MLHIRLLCASKNFLLTHLIAVYINIIVFRYTVHIVKTSHVGTAVY